MFQAVGFAFFYQRDSVNLFYFSGAKVHWRKKRSCFSHKGHGNWCVTKKIKSNIQLAFLKLPGSETESSTAFLASVYNPFWALKKWVLINRPLSVDPQRPVNGFVLSLFPFEQSGVAASGSLDMTRQPRSWWMYAGAPKENERSKGWQEKMFPWFCLRCFLFGFTKRPLEEYALFFPKLLKQIQVLVYVFGSKGIPPWKSTFLGNMFPLDRPGFFRYIPFFERQPCSCDPG